MTLEPLPLAGAHVIRLDRRGDDRGYLERLFCRETFAELGLEDCSNQTSHVWNLKAGTLRGLHYQLAPFAETKLIWCYAGAIFDAMVDIRPGSPTYGQWASVELKAGDNAAIYVPKGMAHAYFTLTDGAGVLYHIDAPYSAEHAVGLRWDDPDVGIVWPGKPSVIAGSEMSWPTLKELRP